MPQPQRFELINTSDKIASAGSCFAQNIARYLTGRNFSYNVCEPAPIFFDRDQASDWGYGQFSCRFGNIYTILQLEQLLEQGAWPTTRGGQISSGKMRDGKWFDLASVPESIAMVSIAAKSLRWIREST